MAARCMRYAVVTAYIEESAPWTRTLRRIVEAGGRIEWKDELTRRVVVKASRQGLASVVEALGGASRAVVVEVKAYCRGVDRGRLQRWLRKEGFLAEASPRGDRIVFYGVAGGRVVMVELWGSRASVKVGVRTSARRLTSVPPASAFHLHPSDAEEAFRVLEEILEKAREG